MTALKKPDVALYLSRLVYDSDKPIGASDAQKIARSFLLRLKSRIRGANHAGVKASDKNPERVG